MKVGLIADVHGNRPALDAVFDEMHPVDGVVCAGDVVGYNPWPADCVDALLDRQVPTVRGNHDRAVVTESTFRFNASARAGIEYARSDLNDDQLAWLAALPAERQEFDGRMRIVHGHPDDPDRYTYPEDVTPGMLDGEDVLVIGHTHVQHVETYGDGIVVNPGSVGQPRDGDQRAAFAVVDLDAMTIETRRVAYDVGAVQSAIRDAGLPERAGSRLSRGA